MHASPFEFSSSPFREEPRRRPAGLQYLEAYAYYFNNPNWFLNLLLTTLCMFIPFVGPIVLVGYEFELILAKHLGTTRTYPDFDFGRFVDYLTRGIWVFLVQMILGLVLLPVFVVGFIGMVVLIGVTSHGQQGPPIAVLMIFPALFLLLVVLQFVIALVMTPLALRAGLTKDFGRTFDLAFVKDFIARVWWETIVAMVFVAVSGVFVAILGLLLCFVGIYPAGTLVQLANTHLIWQLYELYLDRGGIPIPVPEAEIIQAERA